jgi:hypothetical protein
MIQKHLIDKTWFIAPVCNLPDILFMQYTWNSEIDHDGHEFKCLEETLEFATEKMSIDGFLNLVQKKSPCLPTSPSTPSLPSPPQNPSYLHCRYPFVSIQLLLVFL